MTIDVLHLRNVKSYRYPGTPQIPKLFEGKIMRYKTRVGLPIILNPKLIKDLDKRLRKDNYELEQLSDDECPFKKRSPFPYRICRYINMRLFHLRCVFHLL